MLSAVELKYFLSQSLHIHILIGHNYLMKPIDFGFTRSRINVTGALNIRLISADYLENYTLQSFPIKRSD
jgi:hypothetical protein